MKRRAISALLASLISTSSVAASDLSGCKLSVYKVDAKHSTLGDEILAPEQVISIARFQAGFADEVAWQVQLTPAGASANKNFSSQNIGNKIAILCNGKEVSRPTIAGPSGATFVFTTGA
jgi:preprotein translocase subunit SecD